MSKTSHIPKYLYLAITRKQCSIKFNKILIIPGISYKNKLAISFRLRKAYFNHKDGVTLETVSQVNVYLINIKHSTHVRCLFM